MLYSFCSQAGCADGRSPDGGLVELNGMLYGTTFEGGGQNYGTVFSLNPNTGAEKVLHAFCSQTHCADGINPFAGLFAMRGRLYGTTYGGGDHASGTAFSLDLKTGAEAVLHSFCSQTNCADGAGPYAGLIAANGTLYGTATQGGTYQNGALFSLDPNTGAETVLYSFCSQANCTDGGVPYADLLDVKGTLYGTTSLGGAYGGGSVFSFDPVTGTETVLDSFCSRAKCRDGERPVAGLLKVKGRVYGTTSGGGANGLGTVFWVK